jgi:hypothetical protein
MTSSCSKSDTSNFLAQAQLHSHFVHFQLREANKNIKLKIKKSMFIAQTFFQTGKIILYTDTDIAQHTPYDLSGFFLVFSVMLSFLVKKNAPKVLSFLTPLIHS